MKTIREIAEEIGVSRQAIYKKMKQEPLSTKLRGLVSTNSTVSYEGEQLIKSEFEKITQTINSTSVNRTDNQVDNKYIKLLEKNNNDLHEELKMKNNQINALIAVIDKISKSGSHRTCSLKTWYSPTVVRIPVERLAKHQLKSIIKYEKARRAMAREASKKIKALPVI